ADVVDQEIPGDAIHPAAEPAGGKIIPRLVVDSQQRFLRQVLGKLAVARVREKKVDEWLLIAFDQCFERLRVASLDSDHQLIVVDHALSRLPIPSRVEMIRL